MSIEMSCVHIDTILKKFFSNGSSDFFGSFLQIIPFLASIS